MRRLALVLLATTLVAGLSVFASSALANHGPGDRLNCEDFPFREDAQAHLDAHPGDPDRLDQGGVPGVPCEHLPLRAQKVPQPVQVIAGYPPGPAPTVVGQAPRPPTPAVKPVRGRVAFTGADLLPWVGIGLGLLALGTALVVTARRRRA